MTQSSAEKVANVLIGVAAAGPSYYVLKTPRLRRAAWRLASRPYGDAARLGHARRSKQAGKRAGSVPPSGARSAVLAAARRARYDGPVSAQATREPRLPPRLPFVRRAWTRARAEIRLTALAIWRGVTGIYNSNDLTFASSIAYYALLSLFPFFLLVVLDPRQRHRQRCRSRVGPRLRPALLSPAVRVRDHPAPSDAAGGRPAGRRRQRADGLGGDGRVQRDHLRRQSRVGRREAAELPEAQADGVHHARGGQPAAARRAAARQRDQRRGSALVRGHRDARAGAAGAPGLGDQVGQHDHLHRRLSA